MTAHTVVDSLIHARWVIPIEGTSAYLEHHSLVIDQGQILALLPTDQALNLYTSDQQYHLDQHALMPGFINTHGHAAMTLLRGYADDLPLMQWLQEHIWPAEQRYVREDFVRDGTRLAIAEMIQSGTTCFSDNYFYPDIACQVALEAGIRSQLCFPVLSVPTAWAADVNEYCEKGRALYERYGDTSLTRIIAGPHSPYLLNDRDLTQVAQLSADYQMPIQMHIHEARPEIEHSLTEYQQRPLKRLQGLGIVNSHLQAVHMTQITAEDIEIVADAGAHVIHCPESNLKLASGFCPVQRFMDAGVNMALGTDGCASNNDLDMIGETRTAALLAKAIADDAAAFSAHQALTAATLGGAKAMGIDAITGSLAVGKAADVIAVDLSDLSCQPLHNPVSHMVYSVTRHQVSHNWVAGEMLLKDRKLTRLDTDAIIHNSNQWKVKLAP